MTVWNALLHRCDNNIVDKIISYSGNCCYWKSAFSYTLVHIKNFKNYCVNDIIRNGVEGYRCRLFVCYDLFYYEDCSKASVLSLVNELRYQRVLLIRSLLRYIKSL